MSLLLLLLLVRDAGRALVLFTGHHPRRAECNDERSNSF
jgi:hypothetical protein